MKKVDLEDRCTTVELALLLTTIVGVIAGVIAKEARIFAAVQAFIFSVYALIFVINWKD